MAPPDQDARKAAEQDERARAERLADARLAADACGKEPFDLATLERMIDTRTKDGRLPPLEERRAFFEYRYYVERPSVMTLAQLALLHRDLKQW